jgi:hypothetical protein
MLLHPTKFLQVFDLENDKNQQLLESLISLFVMVLLWFLPLIQVLHIWYYTSYIYRSAQ